MTVLSLARLKREMSPRSIGVFERAALPLLRSRTLNCCEHLGPKTSAVVIAGQDEAAVLCPACAYRRFRPVAEGSCRVCDSDDDTMLVGASLLVQRRCRRPDHTTASIEQLIVLARLCGEHRRRVPDPSAPAPGMWKGEKRDRER